MRKSRLGYVFKNVIITLIGNRYVSSLLTVDDVGNMVGLFVGVIVGYIVGFTVNARDS